MWPFLIGLLAVTHQVAVFGTTPVAPSRKGKEVERRLSYNNIPKNTVKIKINNVQPKKEAATPPPPSTEPPVGESEPTQAERFESIRKRLREQNSGNPQNFFSSQSLPTKNERNALLVRISALPFLFNAVLRGTQFIQKSDPDSIEHVRVDFSLQSTIFGRILHSSVVEMKRRLPHRIRSALYQLTNDPQAQPSRQQYELIGHPQKSKERKTKINKHSKVPEEVRKYFQEHEEMLPWINELANCFIGLQLTDFVKQILLDMENTVIAAKLHEHDQWRHAKSILDTSIKTVHDRLYAIFHEIQYSRAEVPDAGTKFKPGHYRTLVKWMSLRQDAGAARVNLNVATSAFADIEKLVNF